MDTGMIGTALVGMIAFGWIMLALSFVVAGWAQSKGRSAIGYLGACMLFTPIVVGLVVLIMDKKEPVVHVEGGKTHCIHVAHPSRNGELDDNQLAFSAI